MSRPSPYPVLITLMVSITSAVIALGVWGFAPDGFPRSHTTLLGLAFLSAIGAVIAGRSFRLGMAWLVLVALATPALVTVPIYRPPVWLFPSIALGLAGFYINGVRERVPLYLSNSFTQDAVSELVRNHSAASFVDLGCGLGDVVCKVAKTSDAQSVVGVETAPLSFLVAWVRALLSTNGRARVRYQNIWKTDVSDVDVVYAFLSPAPMARLFEKLSAEMKPGAIFISNSFAVPGAEPHEVVSLDDARATQLLIWQM